MGGTQVCKEETSLYRCGHLRPLTLGLMLAFGSGLTAAQDKALGDVVVTATRSEAAAEQLAATVSTVDQDDLARRLPRDAAAWFADDPDLAWSRDMRRFGATRPNVRGLEDNRVLQLIDGIRQGDYYNGGGPTNFTLSAPLGAMPDFVHRVEAVRGAGSSLYGSDAMGGVMGTLTLAPEHLLGKSGTRAAQLRATYLGESESTRTTALGAWRAGDFAALLGVSRQQGQETDNFGDQDITAPTRSRPNPQTTRDSGLLAKLHWKLLPGQELRFAVEGRETEADTEVRRLSSSLPRVSAMVGEDQTRRWRLSGEWEHRPAPGGLYDRLLVRAWGQNADTENRNLQKRSNTSASCSAVTRGTNTCLIDQSFVFEQQTTGLQVQGAKEWRWGAHAHLFSFGVDLEAAEIAEKRDAVIRNETTGAILSSLAGESFPLRDFPVGRSKSAGFYLQDEIVGLADGRLSLTPGLRYDWRELEPRIDDLVLPVLRAINRNASAQRDGAWSPKLGALYRLAAGLQVYGQAARAFRAPNYREVNGAFRNSVQSYGVSPNPELRPESGLSLEAGFRLAGKDWRASLAAYDNRYRDFIETLQLVCPSDPRCIAGLANTSMAVNLERVHIYGAELRGSWRFAPGWRAEGTIGTARGSETNSGAPLDSIEPARASVALLYAAERWGAEARARGAKKKTRVDERDGTWFKPPGYGVLDLAAWWRLDRYTLRAAVNNVFDRKYWLWSDIRQADARDPQGVAFYSQPGRSLSLSLQAEF